MSETRRHYNQIAHTLDGAGVLDTVSLNYELLRQIGLNTVNLATLRDIAKEITCMDSLTKAPVNVMLARAEHLAYRDLDLVGIPNHVNLFMQTKHKRNGLVTGDVLEWLLDGYLKVRANPKWFSRFNKSTLINVRARLNRLSQKQSLHGTLYDFKAMKPATKPQARQMIKHLEKQFIALGFHVKTSDNVAV